MDFGLFLSELGCEELFVEFWERIVQKILIIHGTGFGVATSKEVTVESDQANNLADVLVNLLDRWTIDYLFDGFAEITGKLDVLVLHREPRLNQVVKAKIFLKAAIQASAFKLLEE